MRRQRKTIVKILLVVLTIWILSYFFFHKTPDNFSNLPEQTFEDKRNRRVDNPITDNFIVNLRPTPFVPAIHHLEPREKLLQEKFLAGQELLRNAKNKLGSFFKFDVSTKISLEQFNNLDEKTKELITEGFIVPKWNLKEIEQPSNIKAPGEMGEGVKIIESELSMDEKMKSKISWQQNAFNGYASDKISIHRSLQDVRDPLCKMEDYSDVHIDTSVIIIFHNEDWNVLLRTVHSVLDRSPPHLVKEIILVDDFSDRDHLKTRLDNYMKHLGKVKVLRASAREGLIRARLLGASVATGDVLTFLDSHCECTKGWLEPLLQRIQQNESNVVTPVIDVIDENTFQYLFGSASSTNLGGFDWGLQFTWHAIPFEVAQKRKSVIEPLKSPTMAGGLFAINRKYFERIGKYDAGMEVWGGENLEMSFRVWMCGGTLEIIQCSHVGHVFRRRSPYSWTVGDALRRNSVRTALVWMDDYKDLYFKKTSTNLGNYGDISDRLTLRNKLQCKSFKWYLDNIYPDQFVPSETIAMGLIVSKISDDGHKLCLWALFNKASDNSEVFVKPCKQTHVPVQQDWYLTKKNEIYTDTKDGACLDFANNGVRIYPCHGMKGNQEWSYTEDDMILHVITNRCLTLSESHSSLLMEECTGFNRQKWVWERNKKLTS